jgi:hypothetical protein
MAAALLAACLPSGGAALVTRFDTVAGTALPRVAAGFTGEQFVVAWAMESGVAVRTLDAAGAGARQVIPDLPYVDQILMTRQGALVTGGDRFARLSPEGLPQGPVVRLSVPLPGLYRAFAVDGDTLAVAAAEPGEPDGAIFFRTYTLAGEPHSAEVTLPAGSAHPGQVGLALLAADMYLLVWQGNGAVGGLVAAWVDAQGALRRGPQVVYRPAAGGALVCCWASATAQGDSLVVWQDSSPGAWEVMALQVDGEGPVGPARQLSPGEGRDDLDPRPLFDGERTWVAWLSGVHWGVLARSGTGRISLLALDGASGPAVYAAPDGLEGYTAAAHDGVVALVGVAPADAAVVLYSTVITP